VWPSTLPRGERPQTHAEQRHAVVVSIHAPARERPLVLVKSLLA